MNFLKKLRKWIVLLIINYAVLPNIIFSFVHYIHIIRPLEELYCRLIAGVNESLLDLYRSRQQFSNSWEEKYLSACTDWRLYTTQLKGSQSFETSDETENKASQSMLCFLLKNKSDWSKLLLFWKNNEMLRTSWEWELYIFIRSLLWLTSYQLKKLNSVMI